MRGVADVGRGGGGLSRAQDSSKAVTVSRCRKPSAGAEYHVCRREAARAAGVARADSCEEGGRPSLIAHYLPTISPARRRESREGRERLAG